MATVPTYRTWVAGEIVTAAYMNSNVRDGGNFLIAQPLAIVRQSVAQSITSGTTTAVLMDTEDYDSDGMHSTTSNTSRLTCVTAGHYLFAYTIAFASGNGSNSRAGWLRVNGTDSNTTSGGRVMGLANASTVDTTLTGSAMVAMAVGDYVEAVAYQNSTVTISTNTGVGAVCRLQALWIST